MISRYKPLFLSLSFLTLYALTIVFAVPPLTQYTPGETLDPSCAPGDVNCSVLIGGGNFIPLTGTEVGSPVTGQIVLTGSATGTTSGISIGTNDDALLSIGNSNGFVTHISVNSATTENRIFSFPTYDGVIAIESDDRGIRGMLDYSANITNLDYVQKIWVDNNFLPLPTEGTDGQVLTTDGAGTYTWENAAGSSGWGLTGNSGTNPTTNFIGTTDNQDVVIRRNNSQIARFFSDRLSIGAFSGNAQYANMIGEWAGLSSTGANQSNFIGRNAGQATTNASFSNFIGSNAGSGSSSNTSNFIGSAAGQSSTGASFSNFIGDFAGYQATNATYSNFIGSSAGNQATSSTYSNFLGFNAGKMFLGNNVGSNNIIIGTNISLPNATANAINIGGVLFGTNTYATTTGNPSIVPVNNGRIGIATNTLNYTFQAGNNTVSGIVARFQNSTGTCDINPTTTSLVCSSDETLKSNITSLDASLASLSSLRPVTYTWNTDSTNAPQVGFIAQEVEQIFPSLVFTDTTTGLKSLAYTNLIPYTISALQDINLSLTTLDDTQKPNVVRDALVRFLESATNGIGRLFAKEVKTEKLCIGDTSNEVCINQEQLRALIEQGQIQTVITSPVAQKEMIIEDAKGEESIPSPILHEALETVQEESTIKDITTE